MQIITPVEINESRLNSSISEPDPNVGEAEWIDTYDDHFYSQEVIATSYTTFASSSYSDYIIRRSTYLYIDKYVDGVFSSTISTSVSNRLVRGGVYYGGELYIVSGGETVDSLNATTGNLTSITIVNDPSESPVYTAICRIDSEFYLYDYANSKIIVFTLSGTTFTYTRPATYGFSTSAYASFTSDKDDNILSLAGNVITKYSNSFEVLSETTLDLISEEVSKISGISNTGTNIKVFSGPSDLIVKYESDLSFSSLYKSGDQAILASTHKLYQCIIDYTFDSPDSGVLLTPPSWIEVSATNKFRMFDYVISTQSTNNSTVNFLKVAPEQTTTSLSIYGMNNISKIFVIMRENNDSGTIIYDKSKDLTIEAPDADNLVNDSLYASKVLFDDLPDYSDPWIAISCIKTETLFYIGDVVFGNPRTLGAVTYQSSTNRKSYDVVEIDDYGNTTVTSRPSAEYTTFELAIEPRYANYVERILKDSLNEPRVYIGDRQDGEKMFTLGYYERSPLSYDAPKICTTTLKVRGLV